MRRNKTLSKKSALALGLVRGWAERQLKPAIYGFGFPAA
jgi:hypothetical protein